jgi:hypothetical protein
MDIALQIEAIKNSIQKDIYRKGGFLPVLFPIKLIEYIRKGDLKMLLGHFRNSSI